MQSKEEEFYRARTNVISMLIDRGYLDQTTNTTEGLQKRYISYDEFKQLYQTGDITMDIAGVVTKQGLPVYVSFIKDVIGIADLYDKAKDGNGKFNEIAAIFKMDGVTNEPDHASLRNLFQKLKIIIVFVAARHPTKNKYQINVENSFTIPEYPNVELWPVHRLQVNYSKHTLIKPHRILSEEEKQYVLHRFNCNILQMPEMCINDPLNRWYNALPGDIYKVKRGTAPHYVIVVSRKMPVAA